MTQQEKLLNAIVPPLVEGAGGRGTPSPVGEGRGEVKAITKPKTPFDLVCDTMEQNRKEFEKALAGSHILPDKFLRIARTVISKNPGILECDKGSIVGAFIEMAIRGFEPSSGEGHIVPFTNHKTGKKIATMIPGWKGLMKLFYNHHLAKELEAEIIHENDIFEYEKGSSKYLRFRPAFTNRGKVIGYYAKAELTTGGWNFAVLSIEEAEEHRDKYSKSYNSDKTEESKKLWLTHFDDMAIKTALLKCLKYMPFDIIQSYMAEPIASVFNEKTKQTENITAEIIDASLPF